MLQTNGCTKKKGPMQGGWEREVKWEGKIAKVKQGSDSEKASRK